MSQYRFPILLALLVLSSACATTQTKPVDPQKQAELDQQYQQLLAEKAAIQAEISKYSGDSSLLFGKATDLERKLKLGRKDSYAATSSGGKGKLSGTLGPISFDKKSATFRLKEGPTSGSSPQIRTLQFELGN